MPPREIPVKSATLTRVFRRDYIQRQIERLAEALARIAGHRARNDLDAAQEQVAEAYRALDLDPGFLRLDPSSLVMLVGDAERVGLLARVLEEEAGLADARGAPDDARRKRKLAAALDQWVKSRSGS